jgi:hypothetical protein
MYENINVQSVIISEAIEKQIPDDRRITYRRDLQIEYAWRLSTDSP